MKVSKINFAATSLAIMAVAVFGQVQSAAAKAVDSRISQALVGTSIAYNVSESGNLMALIPLGNSGRTQAVVVNSETETYRNTEIREVWAIGYRGRNISQDAALKMLEESAQKKMGAWEVTNLENDKVAHYTIKIDANSTPEELVDAIILSANVADSMEQKLTSRDNY